jgi:hypothetical protein
MIINDTKRGDCARHLNPDLFIIVHSCRIAVSRPVENLGRVMLANIATQN